MASSRNLSSTLFIGQTFALFDEVKESVLHVMVTQRHSFKVASSDRTRFHAICRSSEETGCKFFLQIAYMNRSDQFELRKLVPHTCDLSSHQDWKASRSAKLIAHRQGDMVKSDFRTRPRQIQTAERLQHSNQISYLQAWRAKKEIQKNAFMDKTKSFQLILPFLQTITDDGLDTDMDLMTKETMLLRGRTLPSREMTMDPSNGAMWRLGLVFMHFGTPDSLSVSMVPI